MDTFIVPHTITDHKRVNEVLGADWLKQQVETIRKAKKIKPVLHPARMSPAYGWATHHLIVEANSIELGRETPLLDSLETDIMNLSGTRLPSNLGDRIKDDHDFSKVAYELRIAAGFCRLGHRLIWIPTLNQPHPEFIVFLPDLNFLSVECKKRDKSDGYEQDGAVFWKHFQYKLIVKMKEAALNYWVKLTSREFNVSHIDSVVAEIISVIQSSEWGQFDSQIGSYQIEYTKLANPGQSISMDVVNMFPRGVFGINMGTQKRNQIMVGPVENPKLLRLEVIDDLEHRIKGVLRNLRTAARQVIEGITNLVYIDINIPEYEREQEEFSNFVEAVKQVLAVRHRQISAVVLTNIYPALTLDEYLGWRIRTELIEHPNPLVRLPSKMAFPGDNLGTQWLPGAPSVHI